MRKMLASLCVLNVFTIRGNIRPKKEDPKSLLHNDQLMMWEEQRSLTLNSGNTSPQREINTSSQSPVVVELGECTLVC